MFSRRRLLALTAALPAAVLSPPARAGQAPICAEDGIALRGADPVDYFAGHGPVPGSVAYGLIWNGAVWLFSSAENREAFESDPNTYLPRYGGYCALAMTRGEVAMSDPEAWTLHRGALYLTASLSARRIWRGDIGGHVRRADAHWPRALNS